MLASAQLRHELKDLGQRKHDLCGDFRASGTGMAG